MEILTGEQMRDVDRRAIEGLGIPGLTLMEAAGMGVAHALLDDFPEALSGNLLIVCGKGNNGGDGLVAARHLARRGLHPQVLLLGREDQLRGDALINYRAAVASGVSVNEVADASAWSARRSLLDEVGLVVDAILGTGATRAPRGLVAQVIEDIVRSRAQVVSIDLPSGLSADSTEVQSTAIRAERTYTLCRPKLSLVIGRSATHAGELTVIPIGIPDHVVAAVGPHLEWLDAGAARQLLPRRDAESHKGTYGHLLAVAGGPGTSGAAVLLCRAALRCGVGLVTAATAASSLTRIAVQQAELMTEPLPETVSGSISRSSATRALDLLTQRDALALGPGLGTEPGARAAVASMVGKRRAPIVLDADGLNAFALGGARSIARLKAGRYPMVLTPHVGEAARLLGQPNSKILGDRLAAARRLVKRTGATVVLKGHRTLVASPDGSVAVNSTGNPGMATAGTGDVLTGAVGAFLAQGMSARDAARLAVYVHGAAGDRAARRFGTDGLIASDVIDELPAAIAALRKPNGATAW